MPSDPRTACPRSLLCCRPLSTFIAIGFEHCIANMVRSSMQGVDVAHAANVGKAPHPPIHPIPTLPCYDAPPRASLL